MEKVYYAGVAPNKEAAIYDGLTEAILKCMNNQIDSFFKETIISSLRIKFKEALYKFNEDNAKVSSPYIVETYNDDEMHYKAELIYVNELMFKHYYIRFEWLLS